MRAGLVLGARQSIFAFVITVTAIWLRMPVRDGVMFDEIRGWDQASIGLLGVANLVAAVGVIATGGEVVRAAAEELARSAVAVGQIPQREVLMRLVTAFGLAAAVSAALSVAGPPQWFIAWGSSGPVFIALWASGTSIAFAYFAALARAAKLALVL
jgi:hypothetical protein